MGDEGSKERRYSERNSPSKGHERRHSHIIEQRKMDTTIMSDIEYLNIFPDMEN